MSAIRRPDMNGETQRAWARYSIMAFATVILRQPEAENAKLERTDPLACDLVIEGAWGRDRSAVVQGTELP